MEAEQGLPWRIIDMVCTFADIPLRQPLKNSVFRNDHAEHGVHIFNAALLAAPHGIAVIDACPGVHR